MEDNDMEGDDIEFRNAGTLCARQMMRINGLPDASMWIKAHMPDLSDPESIERSGHPLPFWTGCIEEFANYRGTA